MGGGSGAIVRHRLETFSIVYCNNTNLSNWYYDFKMVALLCNTLNKVNQ